jgi:uncharacterized repeat protein (TIGR04076 family)
MFKVKATVLGFLGNMALYPCHMQHNPGDEVIFDGGSFQGRLCPDVWPLIVPKVHALHVAGPRYVEPHFYYPYFYTSVSVSDPAQKVNDGLGFRSVLKTIVPPQYNMATLMPSDAFIWPPRDKRVVAKDIMVTCPDTRSAMVVKLEAFDISDGGYDIPYFRRQMAILQKILRKGKVKAGKIMEEFTRKQIEGIYPVLSPIETEALAEELELMGYLKMSNGIVNVTKKGEKKLAGFKASLPAKDLKAFEQNYKS